MFAKKMLRVTALAMALVFMFSAVALAATPSVIYYQNEQGTMVKADYQQALDQSVEEGKPALLNYLKTAFIDAQDKFRDIFVKNDDGSVINWQKALQAGKSYQEAVNNPEFATSEPEHDLELVVDENGQVVEKPIVIKDTAVADVTFGALGFTDIAVKSTTVPGATKFKVAGSTVVADLGSAIRILKGTSQSTVEITLLASDGVTVKATGTLTFPAQTTADITFNVTAQG